MFSIKHSSLVSIIKNAIPFKHLEQVVSSIIYCYHICKLSEMYT
jgi:hypothetical protein